MVEILLKEIYNEVKKGYKVTFEIDRGLSMVRLSHEIHENTLIIMSMCFFIQLNIDN
ncbi:hypothetical protein SDC9_187692 [bioreactor metagenome]|uniref:Uncharacterized protein n=1 Tax=bioreactor metagenome TaxID=1076179 RepID=A0A645HNK7_9ZZZZ